MSTPVVLNPLTVVADGYGRTVGVTPDERFKVDILTTQVAAPHADTHTQGGSDEINGDQIDIDYNPENYTQDGNDGYLGSHLAGIDNTLGDILDGLDGYCTVETCDELDERVTNIQNSLDGYGSQAVCDDIIAALDGYAPADQVTEIQLALDGYCTVETCDDLDQRVTDIQNSLDGYSVPTDYLYAASEGLSSTTSTSYQTKVTLNTGTLDGTYLIQWTATLDGKDDKLHRVRLRDTTNGNTLAETRHYMEDENTDRFIISSFIELGFSSESRSISIQWRTGDSGEAARIRDARIVMWKVEL